MCMCLNLKLIGMGPLIHGFPWIPRFSQYEMSKFEGIVLPPCLLFRIIYVIACLRGFKPSTTKHRNKIPADLWMMPKNRWPERSEKFSSPLMLLWKTMSLFWLSFVSNNSVAFFLEILLMNMCMYTIATIQCVPAWVESWATGAYKSSIVLDISHFPLDYRMLAKRHACYNPSGIWMELTYPQWLMLIYCL